MLLHKNCTVSKVNALHLEGKEKDYMFEEAIQIANLDRYYTRV